MEQRLRIGLFILGEYEASPSEEPLKVVGYTDGSDWNGWATPKFELGAIEKWLKEKSFHTTLIDGKLIVKQGYKTEPDVYTPKPYQTVEGEKILYYLKGWNWTEVPLPKKVIIKERRGRIGIEAYSDCIRKEYGYMQALFSRENFIHFVESSVDQLYCKVLEDGTFMVGSKESSGYDKPSEFKPQSFYTVDGIQTLYQYYDWPWEIVKSINNKPIEHGYFYCVYHGSNGSEKSQTYGPFRSPLFIENGDLYSPDLEDPVITTDDYLKWHISENDEVSWDQLVIWYQ
jgi:hypothetical protein